MKIKLVRIVGHKTGWKGTWYRIGQEHFVQQDPAWPKVVMQRWRAVDVSGSVNEDECEIVRGPMAWLRCVAKTLSRIPLASKRGVA